MKRLALLFVVAALLSGCRTMKDILDDYERDLKAGSYEHAAIEVGELSEKNDDNVVFWRLQTAGARYLADRKDESIALFDRVEDGFYDRDHDGAVKTAADATLTMIGNDCSLPYTGTGEDRVFTSFYKAVDFAALGRMDGARTELNRAAQRQENWLWERQAEIADAAKKLDKDAAEYAKKEGGKNEPSKNASAAEKAIANSAFRAEFIKNAGLDPMTAGHPEHLARADYLNAYIQHATGVFRWLNGDPGAIEFFKSALDVKANHPLLKGDAAAVETSRPTDQVWVYVEDGLSPAREEWRLDLPMFLIPYANRYVLYAGMAFPKLRVRDAAARRYTLSCEGASRRTLAELEDVERLVKAEFDVYMGGCIRREIARTLTKVGLQVGFGIAADVAHRRKERGKEAGFLLAQRTVAAWARATTAADIRSWTALPKKVYAIRVTRPANGKLVLEGDERPIAEITLPPGNAMVFVRKVSAQAPAVVKTVTFK